MIRLGLLGARGKMGQQISRLVATEFASKAALTAPVDQGEPITALLDTDAVIDFSSPAAMLGLAREARAFSGPLPVFVVGSTGWKAEETRELEKLAEKTAVLMSSNFSTGVLATLEILKTAAPLLTRLGYTPVIVERHHRHKKDAPSGTAISLQRAISPEDPGRVQTHAVRAGEVIGDHEVAFHGPADVITVSHHAQDRSIFARGAIEAGLWLARKRNALAPSGKLLSMGEFFKEL